MSKSKYKIQEDEVYQLSDEDCNHIISEWERAYGYEQ